MKKMKRLTERVQDSVTAGDVQSVIAAVSAGDVKAAIGFGRDLLSKVTIAQAIYLFKGDDKHWLRYDPAVFCNFDLHRGAELHIRRSPIVIITHRYLLPELWYLPDSGIVHETLKASSWGICPGRIYDIPLQPEPINTDHLGCAKSKQKYINQHTAPLPKDYRQRQYQPLTKQQLSKWARLNLEPLQKEWAYHSSSTQSYEQQDWRETRHTVYKGKRSWAETYIPRVYEGPVRFFTSSEFQSECRSHRLSLTNSSLEPDPSSEKQSHNEHDSPVPAKSVHDASSGAIKVTDAMLCCVHSLDYLRLDYLGTCEHSITDDLLSLLVGFWRSDSGRHS
jgi:hypothetical protein